MKAYFILGPIAALCLSACATQTVYAPAERSGAPGYSDYRIEQGRYRIVFRGGGGAPEAQVSDYALLRAAELTVQDGYDWFRIIDSGGDVRGSGGPHVSVGGGSASFGRRSSVGLGVGVGFDLGGGPSIMRTIEVIMGRGTPPRDQDAYDARDVQRNIGPRARPAGG